MTTIFITWMIDQVDGLMSAALMADNAQELRRISSDIRHASENLKAWAMSVGGGPILDLGSIGCVEVPADRMTELPSVSKRFEDTCEGTLSIGVGMTISESHSAMKYSHSKGGSQISLYEPAMEDELAHHVAPQPDGLEMLGKSGEVGTHKPVGQDNGGAQEGATGPDQAQTPAENNPVPSADSAAPGADASGDLGQQAEGQHESGDPRGSVIAALQQIKAAAPVLEQMKQSNPSAFQAVKAVVDAMILMAQGMANDDVQKSEPLDKALPAVAPQITPLAAPKPVAPAPAPKVGAMPGVEQHSPGLHNSLEGFMTGLKAMPKGSPERGKFITQHMNHGPFLSALQAHPQGKQLHAQLTSHLNGTANAGFKAGSTVAAVKSEILPGVPHEESVGDADGERSPAAEESEASWEEGPKTEKKESEFPVGTVKDGKVKTQGVDQATGAPKSTSWHSVRSGLKMGPDGAAASARTSEK